MEYSQEGHTYSPPSQVKIQENNLNFSNFLESTKVI